MVFFHRRNPYRFISIDAYFDQIRRHMPAGVNAVRRESRFYSKGLFPRIYNVFEAAFRQGDVNHITGDVHYLAMLLPKRKTILTIHDLVFLEQSSGIKKQLLKYFWLTMPVRRAAIITTVSEATKRQVVKETGCDTNKVIVVPTTINGMYSRNDKIFNSEYPVILQIGTAANKNCLRMAKALQGLRCRLEIIGKPGADYLKVLEDCKIDHRISYRISDEEMLAKYAECDIVLFASEYEGFGMPIIEANSVGRVVVTSNCSSMPEVAGGAACLVDPFDIGSIRAGVERVINHSAYRNELIESGFQNAKRFSSSASAAAYYSIYNTLLN